MKNFVKHFRFLFFALLLVGCSDSKDEDPVDIERTEEDVRNDFKNLIVNTGVNDFSLESNNENFFWDFRIIAPDGASSSNKRPLIISLHGDATSNSDAYKATACLVQPGVEDLNAYIISPSSKGFLWYDAPNQNQILALLDLVKSNLHIDETKVVITGYSDGGNGSWFFAQYYSSSFSASIPMASSYNPINTNNVVQKINIPMYVIHGSADSLFPVEITEGYVNETNAAGSDIDFVIADGLIHTAPCDYVSYLQDAGTWLTTDVWN